MVGRGELTEEAWSALARPAGALRSVADLRGPALPLAARWNLGPDAGPRADEIGCGGGGDLGSERR